MTELTLHGVWQLMKDSSAASSGNPDYQEAHEEHFKWAQTLSEEETTTFQAMTVEIAKRFQVFNDQLERMAIEVTDKAGVPLYTAQWTADDLAKFLGVAQTKGVYTDVLVSSILINQNIALAFDFIEPSEDEEFEVPEDFQLLQGAVVEEEEAVAGD
ncbi:hypothetical protein SEA_THUNDERCLAP_63 [Arthrobacter phage Thunderclap]|uniref:Uncharacterized protein n=1 Tax=Arthrobacter phage Thunderclap TaxID=2777309 RepID=A0A7M1RPE1_9CAUD|nr:hypothetical protein SEA_THUNDERCLAP_63 [Arthrobacter phage Thunderclap]